MSSQIQVSDLICQSCNKRIITNRYLASVVNLDTISYDCEQFMSGELNRVECPHCKEVFTCEIPMIIFSEKLKYACMVSPTLEECGVISLKPPPAFLVSDFKLRAVRYQIEALEKFRINSAGLDDAVVEYIKYIKFIDEDALPFHERNIVFDKLTDGVYHFSKVDFNNRILNTYQFEFPEYLIPASICDFSETLNSNQWHKIDRITIREEINNAKV